MKCIFSPGALLRNASLRFACQWTHLRTETTDTPFTNALQPGQVLTVPIAHGEGNYFAEAAVLDRLEANDQVVFRYCEPDGVLTPEANPNGSARNIAGIVNARRNVLGMMPHPERCAESVLGSADGAFIFRSIIEHFAARSETGVSMAEEVIG